MRNIISLRYKSRARRLTLIETRTWVRRGTRGGGGYQGYLRGFRPGIWHSTRSPWFICAMRNLRPLNSTLSSREFSWSPQWQLVASPSQESFCCCCGGFRTKCNPRCQNNCFTFPHFRLFCICYFLSVCLIVQTTKEREIERDVEWEREADRPRTARPLGKIKARRYNWSLFCLWPQNSGSSQSRSLPVPTASPNSILSLCASVPGHWSSA